MKTSNIVSAVSAFLALSAARCKAEPVWTSGNSLLEVIGYDVQARDSNQKLTNYQTNAVCLLLGYFRGFAESAAIASHYDATALPFFLPDNITNDQIEHVVYNFLAENPDKLKLKGDALIVAALSKEFPNPVFKPPLGPSAAQLPPSLTKPVDRFSKALLSGS